MLKLNLQYGAIGVLCASENCVLPSIIDGRIKLLCSRHYDRTKSKAKENKPDDFIIRSNTYKLKHLRASLVYAKKLKTTKEKIRALYKVAHNLKINGLTANEVAELMFDLETKTFKEGVDPYNTKSEYKKRVSDLKNIENDLMVIGYRLQDNNKISEVLALKSFIPGKYFGNTILDRDSILPALFMKTCDNCGMRSRTDAEAILTEYAELQEILKVEEISVEIRDKIRSMIDYFLPKTT